jgi:hypothetical protein
MKVFAQNLARIKKRERIKKVIEAGVVALAF